MSIHDDIQKFLDEMKESFSGDSSAPFPRDFDPDTVDTDYITHRSMNEKEENTTDEIDKKLEEPTDEIDQDLETTQDAPEPKEDPSMDDPSAEMGDEPGTAGMGADPTGGMAGMDMMGGEDEAPESPKEVGRIYELKKIFSRLTALDNFLSTNYKHDFDDIKQYIKESIQLFKTLISNIKLYKDKIDDIIISYYKFLDQVYSEVSKKYKNKEG